MTRHIHTPELDELPHEYLARSFPDLKEEIEDEIDDHRFKVEWHGRPMGTNHGCKGPLCKKQQRNRVRRPGVENTYLFLDQLISQLHEVILGERARAAKLEQEEALAKLESLSNTA